MSFTKLLCTLSLSIAGPFRSLGVLTAIMLGNYKQTSADCESLVTLSNLKAIYPPAQDLTFLSPTATVLTDTLVECVNYVLDPIDQAQFCGNSNDNYTHLSVPQPYYNNLIYDLSVYNTSCINFLSGIVQINNDTLEPEPGSYVCVSLLPSISTIPVIETTSLPTTSKALYQKQSRISIENKITGAVENADISISNIISIKNRAEVSTTQRRRLDQITVLPLYCTEEGVGLTKG